VRILPPRVDVRLNAFGVQAVCLQRVGGKLRHTPNRPAAVEVDDAGPDAGGQLIDKAKDILSSYGVRREDTAGCQILELGVDADLCARLKNTSHDYRAGTGPARDFCSLILVEGVKASAADLLDGILHTLCTHNLQATRLRKARQQHAGHAARHPPLVVRLCAADILEVHDGNRRSF